MKGAKPADTPIEQNHGISAEEMERLKRHLHTKFEIKDHGE